MAIETKLDLKSTTDSGTVQRSLTICVSRHATPKDWGVVDSPLTVEGQREEALYAQDVADRARFMEGRVLVAGKYSNILRVAASANIFDRVFKGEMKKGGLEHVTYLGFKPSRILQATETLAPLLRMGIPKEEVFPFWMTTPEEMLRQFGSLPPSEVDKRVAALIHACIRGFIQLEQFDKALLPWKGHETTSGGVLSRRLKKTPLFIPFSHKGELVLTIREGEDLKGEFEGELFDF